METGREVATNGQETSKGKRRGAVKRADLPADIPKSLALSGSIRTGRDFANCMSALMSDIISGRITPAVGNAACNAGGKLLKVVEMQAKYGTKGDGDSGKTLALTD